MVSVASANAHTIGAAPTLNIAGHGPSDGKAWTMLIGPTGISV